MYPEVHLDDGIDWWHVCRRQLLVHVSKAKIVEVVTVARDGAAAAPLAAMKKAEACAAAAACSLARVGSRRQWRLGTPAPGRLMTAREVHTPSEVNAA